MVKAAGQVEENRSVSDLTLGAIYFPIDNGALAK